MKRRAERFPRQRRQRAAAYVLVFGGLSMAAFSTAVLINDDPPDAVSVTHWGGLLPVLVVATPVPMAEPTRLTIPAVKLDVRVGVDRTRAGGVIHPANFTDAFWLNAYGTPGTDADNTVYIAGHSSPNHAIVFDALLSRDGKPLGLAGDEITLKTNAGTLVYRFDGAAKLYDKNEIARDPEVWKVVPGRLVLVTCDQEIEGRNAVFYATLQGGA
jgi:hypothetical protein